MTFFTELLWTALLAVTAENILFVGGIGFSRVLRAARKPRTLAAYSLFVGLFCLVCAVLTRFITHQLPWNADTLFMRPAVYALCDAIVYFIAAFGMKTFMKNVYEKVGAVLAPAAINGVVISIPYAERALALDLPQIIGFAIGTGVAFFIASCVMTEAFDLCRHEDMPKSFKGLPAMLLYVGILSMAFIGFSGTALFH